MTSTLTTYNSPSYTCITFSDMRIVYLYLSGGTGDGVLIGLFNDGTYTKHFHFDENHSNFKCKLKSNSSESKSNITVYGIY